MRRRSPPLAREAVVLFERLVSHSNEEELKPQRMIVADPVPKSHRGPNGYEASSPPINGATNLNEQYHSFDDIPVEIHQEDLDDQDDDREDGETPLL